MASMACLPPVLFAAKISFRSEADWLLVPIQPDFASWMNSELFKYRGQL